MKCPANSHYEVCAEPCSSSCPGLTQIVQCSNCTEGCECDSGFVFNGQTCVKETECGCYENGKTYKVKCNTKKLFHVHVMNNSLICNEQQLFSTRALENTSNVQPHMEIMLCLLFPHMYSENLS